MQILAAIAFALFIGYVYSTGHGWLISWSVALVVLLLGSVMVVTDAAPKTSRLYRVGQAADWILLGIAV
jgi:uncharacterized membrane protein